MQKLCKYCGQEQPIVETVSWQLNLCSECGNSIESQ